MQQTFSQYKKRIEESMSSIFSKEDVIKLIEQMEQNAAPSGDTQVMEKIAQRLGSIKEDIDNLEVDYDDVEFQVKDRTIEVYNVDIRDKDDVISEIESLIDEVRDGKVN